MNATEYELQEAFSDFQRYMYASDWDALGVYEDDGLKAIAAFIEYCVSGEVTFDD